MTLIVTSLAFLFLSSENRTNTGYCSPKNHQTRGFTYRIQSFVPKIHHLFFATLGAVPRVLSDVACCTATCYNTLARTANEANPYRHTAEQTPLPSLPSWEHLELPVSALTLKDSMVERPQGILRHWQSCRLLLTKEGSVYCYDGDIARNSPVWSGRFLNERRLFLDLVGREF